MAKSVKDNENNPQRVNMNLNPRDYTDVGQAELLKKLYENCLCYCEGIGWLTYENGVWIPSDISAQRFSQKLTELQIQQAESVRAASFSEGKEFYEYACSRRSSARIAATLKEAIPMLEVRTAELDADPLILNTPDFEIRLDTGAREEHDPGHRITHITTCSPSNNGAEIWNRFLLQITCGDKTMIDFLQQFAGMAAIGKVYEERLVIAVGSGGNGKSTFFNALQDVLGDYAGTIRSELMIASNDSGKKFEYARLRGKRFIIAEELEEGKQLDTAAVKHLCSTGDINAQFKGKDIFTFKPSHSTVLCTNHMPSVNAIDSGTWDRIIVIPFRGRFRNQKNEIKNYGAYLVENCGGYILQWIIEGAQKYIANEYKLSIPEDIQSAIKGYQEENDWAADFFAQYLCFAPNCTATGKSLYEAYVRYSHAVGTNTLPQTVVLPRIAAQPGVVKKRTNQGMLYYGVEINDWGEPETVSA